MTTTNVDRVVGAFAARPSGDGWSAKCGAHPDRNASLSIGAGRNGGVVIKCHAGCDIEDVVAAAGLTMLDLAPEAAPRPPTRRQVATYPYTDEAGDLLFEAVRYDPKDFRQRHPNGNGGWTWNMNGTRRVPYKLPELLKGVAAGRRVFIAEGEKDVDALARAGEVATCGPMGAGKWGQVADLATEVLAGAEVIIVADKDKAGRAHAAEVAASLDPVAASVIVVEAATGKDAAEHLGAGRAVDDLEVVDLDMLATTSSDVLATTTTTTEADARWPVLGPAALHGLAGEVVATLDPHTEADQAAVLISFLAAFGCAVSAGPHAIADGSEHPGRLFAVLVGKTSRGRKGTAWSNVRRIMAAADPAFTAERILGGLASGEGLIAAVSDGTPDKDGNLVGAVRDKRLLVYEPEFSRVLKVCARDSSTLSAILRDAWDRGDLRVMTRKDPLRASGAHVGLLAHVTADELKRSLLESDAANGYGNRHLFIAARRSKRLPAGGNLDDREIHDLGSKVANALTAARPLGILRRSEAAAALWEEIYLAIDDDVDGMVGALTARCEAQLLRLSVVYALLDGSRTISVEHIRAAEAVWNYSADTLTYVFGEALGDEVADRLLAALRHAGAEGLDRQAQRDVFGRNVPAARLALAREALERKRLVTTTTEDTGGRPRTVTRALPLTQETPYTQEGMP